MSVREDFRNSQTAIARCPHIERCRRECRSMSEAEPPHHEPKPDFIGRRYGEKYPKLVIVGGNPGIANKSAHYSNDMEMRQNMDALKEDGTSEGFEKLMHDLRISMDSWLQVVSVRHQRELDYNLEDVAYVNLVKCATKDGGGNTKKIVGKSVFCRCWEVHTKNQIEILKPDFVINLWKQNFQNLNELGLLLGRRFASFSGQRNLKEHERLKDVKKLIAGWKAGCK